MGHGQAVTFYDPMNARPGRVAPRGAIPVLDFHNHLAVSGDSFSVSHVWNTIANEASGDFLIRTGSSRAIIQFSISMGSPSGDGGFILGLHEDPTIYSTGTEVPSVNRRRGDGKTLLSSFYHTTNCESGDVLWQSVMGLDQREKTLWHLSPDTDYYVHVLNKAGAASLASINLEVAEISY